MCTLYVYTLYELGVFVPGEKSALGVHLLVHLICVPCIPCMCSVYSLYELGVAVPGEKPALGVHLLHLPWCHCARHGWRHGLYL